MPAVSYALLIDGAPVSGDLMAAIQQLEVEDHTDKAAMLRLRLGIGVGPSCGSWAFVDDATFQPLANVQVLVSVGSKTEPLISAFVINTNGNFSNRPGESTLEVVAMDPSIHLHLKERVKDWPNMTDSDVASAIFADAAYAQLGLVPVVDTTTWRHQQDDHTLIQQGTDMQFLKTLAHRNGFQCYVEMNPATSATEAHFHAPRLNQPQPALSVNMGPATNVNSFTARYDMIQPATVEATGLDVDTAQDQAANVAAPSLQALGSTATGGGSRPRHIVLTQHGMADTGELQTHAQALVDESGWAITGEGEVNTVTYGGILRAKRVVPVRGAGSQFSGTYLVERVLHTFAGTKYTQHFTLRRNALGLKGSENFTAAGAPS
jgi:phage protein D